MNTLTSDPSNWQETSGCEKRGGKEEAATHKETSERVHALHEGNESQSGGRVHTERERSYQPDPRPKGERGFKNTSGLFLCDGHSFDGCVSLCVFLYVQWHALSREEQAKYYELARKERQLHMQLYPGWSARDNYVSF